MRAVIVGIAGSLLLVVGLVVGVGGLAAALTDSCTTTYRLTLQSAASVDNPPARTVAFESLSTYQQTAVTAALENETRVRFGRRAPLAALDGVVIETSEGRYVAALTTYPCRAPWDELAIGGFLTALIGGFAVLYGVVRWRYS